MVALIGSVTKLRGWLAKQLKATTLYMYVCVYNQAVLSKLSSPTLAVLRLGRPRLFPDSSLQLCLTK